jgi:hypothetical protein
MHKAFRSSMTPALLIKITDCVRDTYLAAANDTNRNVDALARSIHFCAHCLDAFVSASQRSVHNQRQHSHKRRKV